MSQVKRILIFLLIAAGLSLLGGCAHRDPDESQLSWTRPASWEGKPPGLL